MHYAEFAEDEVRAPNHTCRRAPLPPLTNTWALQSVALLNAIKEYDANRWKVIGAKLGKPAKVSPSLRTTPSRAAGRQGGVV